MIEEFFTFYQAGTETTAHLMMMMVYYLILNPEVEKRVRKDVEKIIQTDADITPENLKKLVYIEWIQNETTRMYGPGTGIIGRVATKDHYLGKIPIHKGTCLSLMTLGIHYSEKYYKDPELFRPERWEN